MATASAAAVEAAAVEAIDLLTYDGEDPFLIREPACQKCRAKQSETQLARCPGCALAGYCALFWYCSECIGANSEQQHQQHSECLRTVTLSLQKWTMDNKAQALRQQHQITDPFVPTKSIPEAARRAHKDLVKAVETTANNFYMKAHEIEVAGLWEMTLDLLQKKFRMLEGSSRLHEAKNIVFTLIRLDRLEDAWRFIRNTMVTYNSDETAATVIQYEPQDRYTDCLDWVRSSYPLKGDQSTRTSFNYLILGLIIIKLRIRVAAARNAWKASIKVFLKTKKGKQLDEVKFVLEEYFSLSDDTFQLAQIHQLIGIIQYFGRNDAPLLKTNKVAFTCLRRTPNGPDLLSSIEQSKGFMKWVAKNEPLVATNVVAAARVKHVTICTMFLLLILCARPSASRKEAPLDPSVVAVPMIFSFFIISASLHMVAVALWSQSFARFIRFIASVLAAFARFTRNVRRIMVASIPAFMWDIVNFVQPLVTFVQPLVDAVLVLFIPVVIVGMIVMISYAIRVTDSVAVAWIIWDMTLPLAVANIFFWWQVVPIKAILAMYTEGVNEQARN